MIPGAGAPPAGKKFLPRPGLPGIKIIRLFLIMKHTPLSLSSSLLALALAAPLGAGDWGKAPVGKSPIEECVDLGGEISVGYETDYVFYGVRYARDSVWTDVNYTIEGLAVPVNIGVWYLNGINGGGAGYDELDLYVDFTLGSFAGFDFNLGYYHYVFPEIRSNVTSTGGYGEVYLDIARSLGWADLSYSAIQAFGGEGTAEGWFHELGIEKSFELTDRVGLVLAAGVGYSDSYHTVLLGGARDSGWNHYYVRASLPISLNCRTTLTPYIGYQGAPDTWIADGINAIGDPQSDILHGGLNLTVSF